MARYWCPTCRSIVHPDATKKNKNTDQAECAHCNTRLIDWDEIDRAYETVGC